MKQLLLFFFLFCVVRGQAQTNIYVDSAMSASGSGASWASPYKTLKQAIDAANNSGTGGKFNIYVAKGTYYPPGVQTSTNRDTSFFITKGGIAIYGGYPNGGGTRDITTYPVILSGDIGVLNDSSDNSRHIMMVIAIPANGDSVTLDGLVFTKGFATGSGSVAFPTYNVTVPNSYGAAIYAEGVASALMLQDCRFVNNRAGGNGGAIQSLRNNIAMERCRFTGNVAATDGGGINAGVSNITLSNTNFNDCFAGGSGGALSKRSGKPGVASLVTGCSFTGNKAMQNGGAVYDQQDSTLFPTNIISSDFTNNSSADGGALYSLCRYVPASNTYTISKCQFTDNNASARGGAINRSCFFTPNTVLDSCVFTHNKSNNEAGALMNTFLGGNYKQVIASNCRFENDSTAFGGGGIRADGGTSVENCSFVANKAARGGGLYLFAYDTNSISHCYFKGNRASNNGGGAFCGFDTFLHRIDNSVFSGNTAAARGGGLYNGAKYLRLENVTLSCDSALVGSSIMNDNADTPRLVNCIVWDNNNDSLVTAYSHPVIRYSTIKGGYPGIGNSMQNPRFVNPLPTALAPTIAGDYRLISCSPAINAGFNTSNYVGLTDVDNWPRLVGTTVDMGAYEYDVHTDSICNKSTKQLTNPTAPGSWASSNSQVATVSNTGLVTGVAQGSATITYSYTTGTGCDYSTIIFVKGVNTTVTQSGSTITAAQSGATYQWLDCGNNHTPVTGATNQSFTPVQSGTYSVLVRYGGCADTSVCAFVTGTGIAVQANANSVTIYPNPASQQVTINTGNTAPNYILLRDMGGRVLYMNTTGNTQTTISTADLSAGLYLVEIGMGANGEKMVSKLSVVR